ncbi:MAG TPA: DUF899 domain-containing protein [Solirubrobacteraceae bacterium]|nr:DUF899 domain-containing protein [Solirubrobacteraceae bacterium]
MSSAIAVTREEWLAARAALLDREKEHTRLGDELARHRRELPWLPVQKRYTLETTAGPKTLLELFDGRSQLLIYHFMFGPSYKTGCPVNSSIADSFDSLIPHLRARDVTLIAVSGAPHEKLVGYRERMGWRFEWASSHGSDFNSDLGFSSSLAQTREAIEPILDQLPPVAFRNAKDAGTDIYGYLTELFGFTAFVLEDGNIFQTYSTSGRGVEFLMPYYGFLDRAPNGRDEDENWQLWIRRHDEYDVPCVPTATRTDEFWSLRPFDVVSQDERSDRER